MEWSEEKKICSNNSLSLSLSLLVYYRNDGVIGETVNPSVISNEK